jgi:S-adenosylmethionine:tRNA ribosyltransferase-isomerase
MKTVHGEQDYDFSLPEELIAQEPPEASGGERSDARLAVIRRETDTVEHGVFRDLGKYLDPQDVLVLNNARVVPTILHGEDETGRAVVFSVFSPTDDGRWHCLVAPSSACRAGASFLLGPGRQINSRLLERTDRDVWRIALDPGDQQAIYDLAEPVYPGYLKRAPADPEQYQTAYGSRPGAVLFPSAGRHFTPQMLAELRSDGTAVVEVTLLLAARTHYFVRKLYRDRTGHAVGAADDPPAVDETGFDFPHAERYEVAAEAADQINERRSRGGRVLVCGTSALRTIETVADDNGRVWPGSGFTELRITPGHRFLACDAFLTNLHRPKSSELLLTAAFAGPKELLDVYRKELVPRRYQFHEFGDSMLIV